MIGDRGFKMISNKISKWYSGMLDKAATLGQLSDVPTYKIGAILVFRKSIIATGFNKQKSHPLQLKYNQYREVGKRHRSFVHAEIDCLKNIRYVPKGATLFVGRKDMQGNPAMCRPCEACLQLIMLYNITEIVYNTPNGFAIEHLER